MVSFTPLSSLLLALPLFTFAGTLHPRQWNPTTIPAGVSADGRCGVQTSANVTCVGSPFGDCCSQGGFCGSSTLYCGVGNCQAGACNQGYVPGASYTQDGTCGPKYNNWLCGDREWGPCCSNFGYCGSDEGHCGVGFCQSGACKGQAPASGGPSLDGHCGPRFPGDKVCSGTKFGTCCSKFGFCGNGTNYCAKDLCSSGDCLTA